MASNIWIKLAWNQRVEVSTQTTFLDQFVLISDENDQKT